MEAVLPTGLDAARFSILLASFGIDANSAVFVGGSQNFVYRVDHSGNRRIARVSVMRHRTAAEIQGELEWIEYLSKRGIPICTPQTSASGAGCEELVIDGRSYLLTVFEEAAGRKATREDLSVNFCRRVGELIGRMHAAAIEANAAGFRFQRGCWNSSRLLTSDLSATKAPLGNEFRRGVSRLIQAIAAIPATRDNYGILHGDVNMGNIHIREDGLQIFDFDNAEYGYFLQDLVVMLYDSIYSRLVTLVAPDVLTSTLRPLWDALVAGYRRFNPGLVFSSNDLRNAFLLREAIIYVHHHRVLPPDRWSDPYLFGMRRHVEQQDHPLGFASLAG
ncbi:MAG TPA: phosphotransferase [Steroidobacteraceae bacterium]|nr:phosphotransferase [Steroidobacteraceae bacterium]